MSLTMLRDLAVFSSLFLRIIVLPFQKVNKVVCVIIYLFFFTLYIRLHYTQPVCQM